MSTTESKAIHHLGNYVPGNSFNETRSRDLHSLYIWKPVYWLRPRDKHVTQNLCQSVVRERLAKYVKYNTKFLFRPMFFSGSPTEVTRERILTYHGSKHAEPRKDVPFGDLNDGRQHLWVQISPKKRQDLTCMCNSKRLNCARLKNNVIDEWSHWRRCGRGCELRFYDHCKTYRNLMPNCYHKIQTIVPIHTVQVYIINWFRRPLLRCM